MMKGSPIASAHHFAPIRHLNIWPTQVRRLPPEAQITIAAPIGGPNPPKPIRIECVQDASMPEYASAPWMVQVMAYAIAMKLNSRCRSIYSRMSEPITNHWTEIVLNGDSSRHQIGFFLNYNVSRSPTSRNGTLTVQKQGLEEA